MKILVTGGAGFIGSHLIGELLGQGFSVVCLDSFNSFYDPQIKRKNIQSFNKHPQFQLIEEDIRNREKILGVFAKTGPDVCIHLAAMAGVRPSIQDPFLYYQVNVDGTLNLLEAARQNHLKHFIFGSSSSVYGRRNQTPFSEKDALLSPVSPYAASKIGGESLAHVYHELYGIQMTVLRFFTVYGPRQRPEMAIHKFARLIHEGKDVPMFGDGTSSRDYTFVTDIIQGIQATLAGKWGFEIFNLGDSKAVSLSTLIGLIEKHLGQKAKINRMSDQAGDVPITFADISHAKKLLNYQPKIGIEEGIKNFCKWFLENR